MWQLMIVSLVLCSTGVSQNYHRLERGLFAGRQQHAARAGGERFWDALGGDIEAQFLFGWHALGEDSENFDTGLYWLRSAAANGHPLAAWLLAERALRTNPLNPPDVVFWLRRSAELGFVEAQSGLARMYETGRFVDLDVTEAVRWYRLAAAQKQPESAFRLGRILAKNAETAGESVKFFRIAAESGDSRALYELAMIRLRQDPKLAVDPLFVTISQIPSETWKGIEQGGPTRALLSPVEMLQEALRLGCPNCAVILGLIYDKGLAGARRDRAAAFRAYSAYDRDGSDPTLRPRIKKLAEKRQSSLSRIDKAEHRQPMFIGGFCKVIYPYEIELRPFL